ncbi:AI-2E family transporter [symbiont of Argiope bruennichi]|uniref:AI-2E family transporter n=1 Tax=symbiont of Argiope bruennichi TaxID=2810479 RepID=UPI003DA52BB3
MDNFNLKDKEEVKENNKNNGNIITSIFGDSKLVRVFFTIFCFLIILLVLNSVKHELLLLLIIFLPLFIALITCWLIHPIVKFFYDTFNFESVAIKYAIYFFFLFFVFFLAFLIGKSLLEQWSPFFNKFLGDNASVKDLLNILQQHKNAYITGISNINSQITIYFSDGAHEPISGYIGYFYLFIINLNHYQPNLFTLHVVNSTINFLLNNNATSDFFETNVLSLVSIGLKIGFVVFLSIVFSLYLLTRNQKKFIVWLTQKLWDSKKHQEKVVLIFNKSIGSWIKVLIIDQFIIFFVIFLFVLLAGFVGHSDIFRSSFIIFPLFMCICCFVPIIGPIVGSMPMLLVSITEISSTQNYLPLVFIAIGIMLAISIEALIATPIIFNRTTKLHPITIILSISIAGAILGIWAMPFAIPFTMITKEVGNEIYGKNWKF